MGLNADGWLPALPANIRLGSKSLTVANTLAYNDAEKYALKIFRVQAPGVNPMKIRHAINCL